MMNAERWMMNQRQGGRGWGVVALMAMGAASAQPPLPPDELPRTTGMVAAIKPGESVVLLNRQAAALPEQLELAGVASVAEVQAGDLVELSIDAEGTARRLAVLPRLVERRALLEIATPNPAVRRLWWRDEGRVYPDSIAAADATLKLSLHAIALEGTAAYRPAEADATAATFQVLDSSGVAQWERQLRPGDTVPFRCSLGGGAQVTLRCSAGEGAAPDATACIWAAPTVVLRDSGDVTLAPGLAARLVAAVAERAPEPKPTQVAIALPRVVGVAAEVAVDLWDDALTALAGHFAPAGKVGVEVGDALADQVKTAAGELGAEAVLAFDLRYSPDGSKARARLFSVATGERLVEVQEEL